MTTDDLWGELASPTITPAPAALEDAPPVTPPSPNPMVARYGVGPDGATCGDCVHLLREGGYERTYIKCRLRGMTHGHGTDHRAKWPACPWYVRQGTTPVGQRHTLPSRCGLPPALMALATTHQRCPNCGQLLAFMIGRTHYGVPSHSEFNAEVARCAERRLPKQSTTEATHAPA